MNSNRNNYSGPRAAPQSFAAAAGGADAQHYQTYMAFGGDMQQSTSKIEVHRAGPGVLVLTCHGGLSWEDRDHLSECVNAHFRDGGAPAGVVMDLADVEYINSAGLGALFQLCRLLRNRDAALAFANASDALVRLFRTIGLDRLAQVSDTVEQAVERLAGESEELELLPEPVSGPTSGAAQQAAFQPEREAVKPVKDAGEPATQDPPANAAKRKRRHS